MKKLTIAISYRTSFFMLYLVAIALYKTRWFPRALRRELVAQFSWLHSLEHVSVTQIYHLSTNNFDPSVFISMKIEVGQSVACWCEVMVWLQKRIHTIRYDWKTIGGTHFVWSFKYNISAIFCRTIGKEASARKYYKAYSHKLFIDLLLVTFILPSFYKPYQIISLMLHIFP
jgi:hypothetical protein